VTLKHIPKRILKKMKTREQVEDLSIDLGFPINIPVIKRLRRDGRCRIYYCSMSKLPRDVYVYGTAVYKLKPKDKCNRYDGEEISSTKSIDRKSWL